jgi:hypothetical protein
VLNVQQNSLAVTALPRYKYSTHLQSSDDCPPNDYRELNIKAFRVVYTDPPGDACFLPVALKKPSRRNTKEDSQNCKAFGLSFFTTEDSLRKTMRKVKEHTKNIDQSIGTKIAEGKLEHSDGVAEPNPNGHFTFHEYQNAKLHEKFKVISTTIV